AEGVFVKGTTFTATVDGLQTEVTKKVDNITYNSKMTQLDNAINSKVSQTDADKKYATQTQLTQTSDKIKSRVEEVEGWEIGGRNLLLSTESWERPWDSKGTQTQDAFGGNSGVKTDASLFGYLVSYANMEKFKPDTYTFSMWVKSDIEFDCRFGYRN